MKTDINSILYVAGGLSEEEASKAGGTPLDIVREEEFDDDGEGASIVRPVSILDDLDPKDAGRLVACWNALRGIPTEEIEAVLNSGGSELFRRCEKYPDRLD